MEVRNNKNNCKSIVVVTTSLIIEILCNHKENRYYLALRFPLLKLEMMASCFACKIIDAQEN
jgi:hypothetical protein